MVEVRPEIKEVEPQKKVLFINLMPSGVGPHVSMAQAMFNEDNPEITSFPQAQYLELRVLDREIVPRSRERTSVLPLPENVYLPDYVTRFAGIVITGSPFVAYPKKRKEGGLLVAEWKLKLIELVKSAVKENIPILGICYGEQIISEVLGGKTVRMKSRAGDDLVQFGWAKIKRTSGSGNDPIMDGLPTEFVAPENHWDVVTHIPLGAKVLAEDEYGVQAFRIGNAWGFAFHPERPPEVVNNALKG